MNRLLRSIQQWLEEPTVANAETHAVALHRQSAPVLRPLPKYSRQPILVRREPRPYWEERDWQREGGIYRGHFQTRFGSWPGRIAVSPGGRVEVFIRDPPSVLEDHPHWQCFNKRAAGWYFVHSVTPVADVSAGILGVEKTLIEAFNL